MSMIGNYRRVTLQQLSHLQECPDSISDFLYSETPEADRHLDIDKTWHAIHFLLNGDKWGGEEPLFNTVLGGETLGTQDAGYGPPRFLMPDVVKAVSSSLEDISTDELLNKYDHQRLNDEGIYPERWHDADEDRSYIGQYYSQLTEFFRKAAQVDDALILYVN